MPSGGNDRAAILEQDCRAAGMIDLANSMEQVRRFVDQWWTQALMPWFTDHGPGHSKRVAEYALAIADVPDLAEPHALTVIERYILWSASWLHDIGMQTLPGTPLGAMQPDDYERVRHDHPDQSANEIKARYEEAGLPRNDSPLVQAIAWVARAHGTSYYADTIKLLSRVPLVRNETVRGGLLASILLIADEMDLHYERVAKLPPAWGSLSAVADAHAFKHRQVLGSKVNHVGGKVTLCITVTQSDDVDDIVSHAVQKWITHKLRRQIALVEDAFSGGFNGRVEISRTILVEKVTAWEPVTVADPSSMHTIYADNARSELINHDLALQDLEASISRREFSVIRGRLLEFVDIDGREDLLGAVVARARRDGTEVVECSYLYETRGASTVSDVVRSLIDQLQPGNGSDDLGVLAGLVQSADTHVMIALSSADLLPKHEFASLVDSLRAIASDVENVSVVVTIEPGQPDERYDTEVPANGLMADDVADYLAAFVPWQYARGEARAGLKYSDYKQLGQRHLLESQVGI